MTFQEARDFVIPFGKYSGQTVDTAASTDQGLLYLDWLRGSRENRSVDSPFDLALATYLDDASVKRDLQELLA